MESIEHIINKTIENGYRDDSSTEKKLEIMHNGFTQIIDICKLKFIDESMELYKLRNELDEKLMKIQTFAIQEIVQMFSDIKFKNLNIQPASSFSSRTNLPKESDIDIVFSLDNFFSENIKINKILCLHGYKFKQIMCLKSPEEYHVFGKFIDDIEIEVKVRERTPCTYILEIHKYMDNIFPSDMKPFITYLKFLTQYDKQLYKNLKYIIYNNALFSTNSSKILPYF